MEMFFLSANLVLMLAGFGMVNQGIKENKKNMSALKDTLDGITAKLAAIDEKVLALVGAAQADTLAPETQAALDALVAEVGKVGTDAGV